MVLTKQLRGKSQVKFCYHLTIDLCSGVWFERPVQRSARCRSDNYSCTFLRNAGICLQVNTALPPNRPVPVMWE
jgi:hypothetical protein